MAVKASVLAGAVGVSSVGIVGVVRPFALDLPLRTILKGHRQEISLAPKSVQYYTSDAS